MQQAAKLGISKGQPGINIELASETRMPQLRVMPGLWAGGRGGVEHRGRHRVDGLPSGEAGARRCLAMVPAAGRGSQSGTKMLGIGGGLSAPIA